jgi:uncharacterized protein with PIN domain
MRKDNFEFQKAGEVCENCEERWAKARKPSITLVALPSYTMRYHAPVAICSYCDGPILAISVATAKRREIDAA